MRKLVYLLSVSLDGFLSDEQGSTAWMVGAPNVDYGFAEFYAKVGTIIAGRKTYDELASKTAYGYFPYSDKEFYCVSSSDDLEALSEDMHFIKPDELISQVAKLKISPDDESLIWLAGGAQTASTLLDAGLVDELRIATLPILLGRGISFANNIRNIRPLRLFESTKHDGGVVMSSYLIVKSQRSESELNMAQ